MKILSAPFSFKGESYLGKIYRPYVQVFIGSNNIGELIPLEMIIDTGADYTLLPRYIGLDLQVNFETDCKPFHTSGIGGTERVFLLPEIDVQLGEFKRKIPVGFLDRDEVPPLLGRHLFMETFETYFSSNHTTAFSDQPFRQ